MSPRPLLAGLPEVQELESPSSWITRAALSQGVPLRHFLRFLGLAKNEDCDREFVGRRYPGIQQLCGFPPAAFGNLQEILSWVRAVELGGDRLLMWRRGAARYRVCRKCIAEQVVPHHKIHARFAAWRYCPWHRCMLEDRCWYCKALIVLPADLLAGAVMGQARAYLSQCFFCGRFHHRGPIVELDQMLAYLRNEELKLLDSGRELVATMYRDVFAAERPRVWPLPGSLLEATRWPKQSLLGPNADSVRARARR